MNQERRSHPRIRHRRKVGIILSSGETVYVWSYDISQGGIQVLASYEADVGDIFNIFMQIPDGEGFTRVDVRARIAHVVYDGSQRCNRIGMQFVQFKGDGRAVYERHIKSLVATLRQQKLGT